MQRRGAAVVARVHVRAGVDGGLDGRRVAHLGRLEDGERGGGGGGVWGVWSVLLRLPFARLARVILPRVVRLGGCVRRVRVRVCVRVRRRALRRGFLVGFGLCRGVRVGCEEEGGGA